MDLDRLTLARRSLRRPVPESTQGWQEYLLSSGEFFRALGPLRLRDGYRLRCFVSASGGDASSRLYAVPWQSSERPALPSDEQVPSREEMLAGTMEVHPEYVWQLADGLPADCFRVPVLEGALDHFMQAVEGDDSPYSYLLASFLARDGEELLAAWHGMNWRTHDLLMESPFWSYERAFGLACKVLEAYRNSELRDQLESILRDGAAEFRDYKGDLLSCVRHLCQVRPSFLNQWTSDYQLQLWMLRWDRFNDREGRKPTPEEERLEVEVEIPQEWLAASQIPETPPEEWTWTDGLPSEWEPRVTMGADEVEVRFLTFCARDEAIVRHIDRFRRGDYLPRRHSEVVGQGKGGYMF
jgi:hypothetical protein